MKYIILIVMFFAVSCVPFNKKKGTPQTVKTYCKSREMIQIPSKPKVVDLSKDEIVALDAKAFANTEYVFIPLVIPEKRRIITANQIRVCEDRILIIDTEVGDKVDIFNTNGQWLTDINRKGRGRGEYTMFNGAVYSKSDSAIIVDGGLFRLFYNLNGDFLKKESSSYGVWSYPFGDKTLKSVGQGQMFGERHKYNLTVSIADSVIYKGIPYCKMRQSDELSLNNNTFFETHLGDILYRPPYRDSIYQIVSDSSYMVRYVVKQAKSIWKLNNKRLPKPIEEYIKDGYTDIGHPFYETDEWLYFTQRKFFNDRGVIRRSIFYNIDNGMCYNLSNMMALSPLFDKPVSGLYSEVKGINGEWFIGYISETKLAELCKFLKENEDVNIRDNGFQNIINDAHEYKGIIFMCKCNATLKK